MTEPSGAHSSRLWRQAFASADDEHSRLLSSSLDDVRRRAAKIADSIEEDLRQYTIHDATHLDALWPLVDVVAPNALILTPVEVWTLGVAIALHDLGLALAAYPGGVGELRAEKGWTDARAAALRWRLGRAPTSEELAESDAQLDAEADRAILRERHAERAAELVGVELPGGPLVADEELRAALGATAGRIAASHWWPTQRLGDLGDTEGAPAGMPASWTQRPILLAALLRVADAAHLDALRAPLHKRRGRQLSDTSGLHWDFQGRLRQPVPVEDRLRFTSTEPFGAALADAWWLCADHLRVLDDELAGTDAVLQSAALPRLAVRSVQGARDPRELARFVEVDGWQPVDAQVRVSDVARVVSRIGGRALYGDVPFVPVRELLQNASDAVRARQALRPDSCGSVNVRVSEGATTLEVLDTGVGMDESVLTGALLDFGRSLWESPYELSSVLPGLQAAGFQPVGRFGIGFFSLFMWSDNIDVVSRPLGSAEADTHVLSFSAGLSQRPLLQRASADEQLQEQGTLVRLELQSPLRTRPADRYDEPQPIANADQLASLLGWLAPCLPVDLTCQFDDGQRQPVLAADDWRTIPGRQLLARLGVERYLSRETADHCVAEIGDGAARGVLTDARTLYLGADPGTTVAGGLRVGGPAEICGVAIVDDVDAARLRGSARARPEDVAAWASKQAGLLVEANAAGPHHALTVLDLGADPGDLPFAHTGQGRLTSEQLVAWIAERLSIAVLDVEDEISEAREFAFIPSDQEPKLRDDVVDIPVNAVRSGSPGLLTGGRPVHPHAHLRTLAARAWNCAAEDIAISDEQSFRLVEVPGADVVEVTAQRWSRPTDRMDLHTAGDWAAQASLP